MQINKSPGNYSLTKELYKIFWDHIQISLLLYFKGTLLKQELSTSKKQAVIKFTEEKDYDKKLEAYIFI